MSNFPNVIDTACIPTTPAPPDERCSDPAFALLHPDICQNATALRLKPGVAIVCVLGSIQLEAFSFVNGVETQLTSGVVFTVSNRQIALIGVNSGNLTGVGQGTVTVTATYQGITATANITVLPGLNCCDDLSVATMLVLDKSRSMTLDFGGGYSKKQDFANAVASAYANQTNQQKDTIGLITFNDTPTVDDTLTSDKATVAADALATLPTQALTTLASAIGTATEILLASSADFKVMVLITDGEDHPTNPATFDPSLYANTFKTAGGIIICVGVRANGQGFNLLSVLSTGGFFVNAYPAVVDEAIQAVYALKGYTCAGNCAPPGNIYQNEGALDYTDFINWTVTAGHVDLFAPDLFDVLPGNGSYVSMVSNIAPYTGELTSISSFSFTAGKTYRISFDLAGNQRMDIGTQNLTVKIGDGTVFSQVVSIPDYKQNFTKFSYNFTPQVDLTAQLIFTELGNNAQGSYFGLLLDNIAIDDITDLTTTFTENFNDENLQYVPPACGGAMVVSGGGSGGISDPSAPTLAQWGLPQVNNVGANSNNLSSAVEVNAGGAKANGLDAIFCLITTAEGRGEFGTLPAFVTVNNPPNNAVLVTFAAGLDPRVTGFLLLTNLSTVPGYSGWYVADTVPVSSPTFTMLKSKAQVAALHDPSDNLVNGNSTALSPTGSVDAGVPHQYAVSYLTATGQTALSPTDSITFTSPYSSVKITTPINPDPSVTVKRIWRFAAGAFRLLTEVSPGTADYYDIMSNADFAAFYDPLIVAPTSNTTQGSGYSFYYGYNCYGYGCSAEPPGVQLPDPFPLPDIETNFVPPTTYTATRSYTATCPVGTSQIGPASSVPVMTSATAPSGAVTTDNETSGFEAWRAFGTGPAWVTTTNGYIQYEFVTPITAVAFAVTPFENMLNKPVQMSIQGSEDGISYEELGNYQTVFTSEDRVQFDIPAGNVPFSALDMGPYDFYKLVIRASDDNGSTFTAPVGIALLEILAATPNGFGITKTATETSQISQVDANNKATAAAQALANDALSITGCVTVYTSTQSYTAQCPVGSLGPAVTKSATEESTVSQGAADAAALESAQEAAEDALNCDGSNNQSQLYAVNASPVAAAARTGPSINDPQNYPSIAFVSGQVGVITRIRVTLKSFAANHPDGSSILLVSPAGKAVSLMFRAGGNTLVPFASPVDLLFDSNSVNPLPSPPVAGTYMPASVGDPNSIPWILPAPQSGYLTSFASLLGDDPNGSWSLWLESNAISGTNAVALQLGWTLQVDSA